MKKNKVIIILILSILSNILFAQTEFTKDGINDLRIENEYKIKVPEKVADSVWAYISKKYSNDNNYLKNIDSSFKSKIAEDIFIDQYFDTPKLKLLKMQSGVRHRKRVVLTDSLDRKNGRELMQIKVNNIGKNELNRGEYKYDIKYYDKKEKKYDDHPFLGLVKRKQRKEIIEQLEKLDIKAENLRPTVKLHQDRHRLYILNDTIPFATITLDYVTGYLLNDSTKFIELELELNEILYTSNDEEHRKLMQDVTDNIKADILKKFPELKVDQTPKYNKAAKLLNLKKKSNYSIIEIIVISTIIIILIVFIFLKNNRKSKS